MCPELAVAPSVSIWFREEKEKGKKQISEVVSENREMGPSTYTQHAWCTFTHTHSHTHTHTHTHTEKARETGRQTDTQRESYRDRQTHTHSHTHRKQEGQTDTQTHRHPNTHTDTHAHYPCADPVWRLLWGGEISSSSREVE